MALGNAQGSLAPSADVTGSLNSRPNKSYVKKATHVEKSPKSSIKAILTFDHFNIGIIQLLTNFYLRILPYLRPKQVANRCEN